MEYGNDSDPGARHYIGLSRPYSTVRDRRASNKVQSNSVCSGPSSNQEFWTNSNKLYNSNPNIELLHALRDPSSSGRSDLRRASGSLVHSSTPSSPVKTNESFFAMLQDYQPAVLGVIGTDQRSPGPAEFMQGKVAHATPVLNKASERSSSSSNSTHPTDSNSLNMKRARDPKVKNKLHRFLAQSRSKTDENIPGLLSLSLLTKNCAISEDLSTQYYPTTAHRTFMSLANMEEQQRQRVFAHYDCQSIAANYSHIRKLRAASIVKSPSNASSSSAESVTVSRVPDLDYINYNELVENCPQFCNETGAENRLGFGGTNRHRPRRPVNSYSISILESLPNETLWRTGACPFQNDSCPIEALDHGAYYYRGYFYNQKHENWFGIDEHLGPLAVSLRKDKLPDTGNEQQRNQQARFQFRIIIRTSELLTLRGLVIEDAILSTGKSLPSKELIEFVAPEIQTNCLRLGVSTAKCEQQLLKLDEQALTSKYKVGILYCRSGQCTEEDMYNNEDAGPAFLEFLDTIGKRVRLKGFQHYKAGLDNKTDSTGTHSVHTIYKDCEIMFHVCTMLPFTPNNRQQLLRKRHIGNDIVTIVFQEPGALPFSPKNIRSQFQHVFVIVRAINPCTDHTTYRVAISRSKEVPVFGPPLPAGALFSRNKAFAEYILAKIINAENAAHRSEKFATLAKRTRREYLKDLSINYCTNVYMDPGNKFSIFPSKKKDKPKIRFSGDAAQRGAISWQIMFQDHDSSVAVECFLGISVDTLVIMDEESQHVIFVTPTRAILGWSTSDNSLRIFYHNGECVTINMRYFGAIDEQLEVVERLQAVTLGNGVLEMNIRRNMMGQLGFHVQPDGIVTQVEATGQAWAAGMRRGFRLVEVCKIVVASLSYREMIDLLKTSIQLTFVVIKSYADGSPRRGCFDKHCKINYLSIENDHEVDRFQRGCLEGDERPVVHNGTMQQIPQSALRYEQNLLPYKSTNRSGYNTTSSTSSSNEASEDYKKAFHTPDSCSPHSHNNDKWYDILEDAEKSQNAQNVTLSIHHQYTLKSFAHPKLKESASLPLNSQPLPLSLSDGAKPQTSRQLQMPSGDFPNGKQPVVDSRRLLRNRSSKYDIKCVNFYPSESTTSGISIRNHNQSFDAPNVFEEKHINSTPVHKGSMPNMQQIDLRGPVLPCSTTVKTAKLLPSMGNYSPMNSIQRNMQNYSKTDSFRRDLLELIGPNANNSSACDSLKARRNSAIERTATTSHALDNVSAFMPSDPRQPSTQPTYDVNSNDAAQALSVSSRSGHVSNSEASCRPAGGPHSMLRVSRSSPRLKSSLETARPNLRNEISLTPPLLPDANELDWTTLVDTATQAIVQQFRDENRLKALPLCSDIDNIRNDTDGKLQETLDT